MVNQCMELNLLLTYLEIKIYKTVIVPVALYEYETWSPTLR